MNSEATDNKLCRVLSLDGGGAKGFYTLGVLKELEGLVGSPLCERFDLIFGTSTGAIIAALLALGYSVDAIHDLYKEHVPAVMHAKTAEEKSRALEHLATKVFGQTKFNAVKTGVGLVTTKWVIERPMIFKASVAQAHGRIGTFAPGFGCTISDAVQASCSAYPFFNRKTVITEQGDHVELVDGGYAPHPFKFNSVIKADRRRAFPRYSGASNLSRARAAPAEDMRFVEADAEETSILLRPHPGL